MSLSTISKFGWLAGERTTLRSLGTYGWFYRAGIPIYTISSSYVLPIALDSEAVYLEKEHIVPIDIVKNVLTDATIYNVPLSLLSSVYNTNKVPVDNIRETIFLEKDNRTPIELLRNIELYRQSPLSHLGGINSSRKLPVDINGFVILVSTRKNIPVDILTEFATRAGFPVEVWGLPLLWILDPRSTLWTLDERTLEWLLECDEYQWILSPRDISWEMLDGCRSWVLEERCNL